MVAVVRISGLWHTWSSQGPRGNGGRWDHQHVPGRESQGQKEEDPQPETGRVQSRSQDVSLLDWETKGTRKDGGFMSLRGPVTSHWLGMPWSQPELLS